MSKVIPAIKYITISFAFCIVCAACNSSSEKEVETEMDQAESSEIVQDQLVFSDDVSNIDAIQEAYEQTMQAVNSGAMDSTSFSYDCYGETTGTVTYYRNDGTIRMIENSFNELSHRDVIQRYFVSKGNPYFVQRETTDWSFSGPQETRDEVLEQRFYVLGDTLAQCMTKEYVLESNATDNPDPDEVESEAGQCPPVQELMEQYELLLSHKGETGEIECLDEE